MSIILKGSRPQPAPARRDHSGDERPDPRTGWPGGLRRCLPQSAGERRLPTGLRHHHARGRLHHRTAGNQVAARRAGRRVLSRHPRSHAGPYPKRGYYDHPHDPDDLNRCLLLLDLIPEWKPRIARNGPAQYGMGRTGEQLGKSSPTSSWAKPAWTGNAAAKPRKPTRRCGSCG